MTTFFCWLCVASKLGLLLASALSFLDLSNSAEILLGSKISFFSNSEVCFVKSSTLTGFCLFFNYSFISFMFFGKGTASGFSLGTILGGACSVTTLSFIFLSVFAPSETLGA